MPNNVRIGVSAPGAGKASSEIDRLRDRFDKLQKTSAKGFAIGAGAAAASAGISLIGTAASAATDFLRGSITAASDLNESLSKSKVIFGEYSTRVEKFGDTAARSMGLTKQATIEAAATLGNFFTGAGQSADRAADMSTNLVKLASDLASFNNMDPTYVLDKLQSGLAGEAKPLREVGVFLTEDKVKAKAMALGLADAHGELSEGAKILARYQIILDETKTAQGDFARTSTGLANSQRIANAELEDAQAKLGKELLPAQLAVTRGAADLLEGINATADGFQALQDGTKLSADELGDLMHKVSALAGPMGGLFNAAGDLTSGIDGLGEATTGSSGLVGNFGRTLRTKVIPPIVETKRTLLDLGKAFEGLKGPYDDFLETMYGHQVRAGEVAQAQQDLDDLLKEGAGLKKGTAEWTIWNGKVAEARQRLFDLQFLEKQNEGPKALLEWLEKQKAAFGSLGAQLDGLITKLRTYYKLSSPDYIDRIGGTLPKPGEARASGGPVMGGQSYLVGETGPELFTPSTSGSITTNAKLPGMGGTVEYHYHLTVQGNLVARDSTEVLQTIRRLEQVRV